MRAQSILQRVADLAGVPIRVLSIGRHRSQSMILPQPFSD